METQMTNQLLDLWKSALSEGGFRVTQPRLQVMEIIASTTRPLTPQEIYQRTLESEEPPGIASIYRTLETLDDLGLIQQIHQPDGCHGIWPAVEGHKHLILCRGCSQMQVVEGNENIAEYIKRIEEETGYQVDEHWLQLFGQCEECNEV
jgi:Fe2+ or Zn2+ uptake regulation protein